jgi:hypothetical protein
MFGYKVDSKKAFHHVKHHVGHAYHQTKSFLGHVDNGMKIAKKVYSTIAPLIDKYGGGNVNKKIMEGMSGYDTIKHKGIGHHDEVMHHAHKLKKLI